MSNYWTDYWQQGHLTSFGADIKENYTGALYAGWKNYFSTVKDSQSLVVDIGTGNGALIEIAVNGAECDRPTFYGVDRAGLKISENLRRDNIRFFAETRAEKLPFDDSAIDIVVSQFGIEYSELNESIPEISRILKDGGQFRWIMHERNSSIVKPNSAIFDAIIAMQQDRGLLFVLRQLINALAKFGPQSAQAEQCRNELNGAIQQCVQHNAQGLHGTGFPAFLKAVMNPSVQFKDKKHMLKVFETEMKGQFERLKDLIDASLSESELASLLELLSANGFENVSSRLFMQDTKSVGYLITGVKRGS